MRAEGEGHRADRRQQKRVALLRRRQAEAMVRQARAAARVDRFRRPPFAVLVLGLFLLAGFVAALAIALVLSPDETRNRFAFLLASGLAVWGAVGLVVFATRRHLPARQLDTVAYDAVRQGLLVAGCLELNLATRMLDLWSPLIGGLLVAVFAVFEIVTLGRRPA